MMAPTTHPALHMYQGHRDPIRPTSCLLCRAATDTLDAARFRRCVAETGICGRCHDALDAWVLDGNTENRVHT